MQYPYQNLIVATNQNTIALDANVPTVVNAINEDNIIPFGDYGGPNVYYFNTLNNGLGNIIYTVFDRNTTLGLASFMVRYGAATTIRDIILMPFPRSQVELRHLILPFIPVNIIPLDTTIKDNGTVVP
jgi:hypothetical protein